MDINPDAFSSGQIGSKIWLAEELEKIIKIENIPPVKILCLGGWYGIINFILQARGNIQIDKFRSIDIDSSVETVADKINNLWEWQDWNFKAITDDANTFRYSIKDFNVVINTSIEHIESKKWFEHIEKDTIIVMQSNNMNHDDHCRNHDSLEELEKDFPLSTIMFRGEKRFDYPNWSFTRFMIIGKK